MTVKLHCETYNVFVKRAAALKEYCICLHILTTQKAECSIKIEQRFLVNENYKL